MSSMLNQGALIECPIKDEIVTADKIYCKLVQDNPL